MHGKGFANMFIGEKIKPDFLPFTILRGPIELVAKYHLPESSYLMHILSNQLRKTIKSQITSKIVSFSLH